MAGTSLLLLVDDITSILVDVATMSKVAARKTAGVLDDDLALNAQQVSGVKADRELPVVWAFALGFLRNKAILVPAALAISAATPWAIVPLLMVGGAFLCYEGLDKIAHRFMHGEPRGEVDSPGRHQAQDPPTESAVDERRRRSAARCARISSCPPKSSC